MVIALTGIVCADQVVPAVPETQSLVTGTTADVVGLATETDAGAWTLTNDASSMVILTYVGSKSVSVILFPPEMISQLIAAGGSTRLLLTPGWELIISYSTLCLFLHRYWINKLQVFLDQHGECRSISGLERVVTTTTTQGGYSHRGPRPRPGPVYYRV